MQPLTLSPDRYFDPDTAVRKVARELYESVAELPLICPHGHVDPALLAENKRFEEPASLLIKPDHYIFRMLYSQGVPLESLGIPRRDGGPVEEDPRKIWWRFAELYHLFLGTPTRAWLDHEMHELLGVRVRLDAESADYIYDQILERLSEPSFRPRALFDNFNIEVLTTTDGASDSLRHHQKIRESSWGGRVIPCFRPDAVFKISSPAWRSQLLKLGQASGLPIHDYRHFVEALLKRRHFFRAMGGTSTDHGVQSPLTRRLSDAESNAIFEKGLRGKAQAEDESLFEAHMLMVMADMSVEDGLVMQLHAGAFRNHDRELFERFGPDVGADIPLRTEFTENLRPLLNRHGTDPRFRLVLFTLDESTYGRELAPLAGHYPSLFLGPAWWFFDSIDGMVRYRRQTLETAGIHNTAGFNDDTRAFLSIPARHDLSRRVDANFLAGLFARHVIDKSDAFQMMRQLAYKLARRVYKLENPTD
jgi:glucuronate isomerase